MDKQQDHVARLKALVSSGFDLGLENEDYAALTAAISALTLDEDAVERACEATWPVARFSTEAMTDWARAGTLRQIQHRKVIRAALQAAIHGESQ